MIYLLYCDGSARPNPGYASVGIVCFSDTPKKEIFHLSQYVGRGTNNFAEYMSVIIGLQSCIEYKLRDIIIHMDSLLVINQLNKKWNVNEPSLKPLYERAQSLRKQFNSSGLKWIPRTQNSIADSLANQAYPIK